MRSAVAAQLAAAVSRIEILRYDDPYAGTR